MFSKNTVLFFFFFSNLEPREDDRGRGLQPVSSRTSRESEASHTPLSPRPGSPPPHAHSCHTNYPLGYSSQEPRKPSVIPNFTPHQPIHGSCGLCPHGPQIWASDHPSPTSLARGPSSLSWAITAAPALCPCGLFPTLAREVF